MPNRYKRYTVIGAGHGGKAMAAYLALTGLEVTLFNRTYANIEAIKARGGITLDSEDHSPSGFGALAAVTSDMQEALRRAQVVMVVVPAFAHANIARMAAPYLQDGQIVVLNPGRTFGAIEFRKVLRDEGCQARIILAEAQTFIYASRSDGPAQARIFRTKDAVPLAALPSIDTPKVLDALRPVYPQFIDGHNVLHTGMNNIGAIFHPVITLHNIGWIESTSGEFEFYLDGVTPSVARIMEAIDRERVHIGEAIGLDLVTACEWLDLAYHAEGDNLHEAIHNQSGYRGIKAPATIKHRYLMEDIPMSLVPMASLGRAYGVSVRGMESVIRLACIAHQMEYWDMGRTLESLGLSGLPADGFVRFVESPQASALNEPATQK